MKTSSVFPVPAILIAAMACQEAAPPPPPPTMEEADSAGIRIVTNLEDDRILSWTFSEVFSVGGEESGDYSFFRRSVGTDESGNIFVLDRGNHRVVVLDQAGSHIRTLGRHGGGPGEFDIPVGLAVLPDGQVSVYDVSKHGLVNFAPDGSVLSEERFDVGYTGGQLGRSPQLLAVTVSETGPAAGVVSERILDVGGAEAQEITRLEKEGPTPTALPSCGITIADLPPLFQPSLVWALRGSDVFVSRGAAYVIDVVTPDGMSASYRRPVQPKEATLAMATAEVGEDMRFGPRVCTAADIAEHVGYAPYIPVIADIETAPDGSLWVKRHTSSDEPTTIDILGASGEYLGTLPPGSPFPAAFLPAGRIVAEELDELGVEKITVYEVNRL